MKLKSILLALILPIAATAYAEKTQKPTASKVSSEEVKTLQSIVDELTNHSNTQVNSPEELFKVINGQIQTTDRELPIQATVTKAIENKLGITCYQEGSETVVASTDPTSLGKPVSDFKASEDKSIRDRAIEEIRKNGIDDKAIFTYTTQPEAGVLPVDGKQIGQSRVVVAAGRKAFKGFNSEKKFLCTVAAAKQ